MKKIIIVLVAFFAISNLSIGQNVIGAVKTLKGRSAAKKFNASIPTAEEWKKDVDAKIAAKDCDALIDLKWQYQYLRDQGDTFIVSPVYDQDYGGSQDLADEYYGKVVTQIGLCNRLDLVLNKYAWEYPFDFHNIRQPMGYNYIQVLGALVKGWPETHNGKTFKEELIGVFTNPSISEKDKMEYAQNLTFAFNYDKSIPADFKLIDVMFPYFKDGNTSASRIRGFAQYYALINYQPAVPKLISLLSSDNNAVRYHCIVALGNLKAKTALTKLKYLAENDPFYYVDDYGYKVYENKDAAKQAVFKIESGE